MYVYAGVKGCYLLDDMLKLVEKKLFADAAAAYKALERGTVTAEERELMQKHADAVRIGMTRDVAVLEKAALAAGEVKEEVQQVLLAVARVKIRESIGEDMLIMQAAAHMDELAKAANMLVKRLREWYGLTAPEVGESISDNLKFADAVLEKDRASLLQGMQVALSMGKEFPERDMAAIAALAEGARKMYALKERQEGYVRERMQQCCPNVSAVAGEAIGAKLLLLAGSLKRLAEMPASKLQLLGAEKALFRHLRDRTQRPPKFGIIHEHAIIARVEKKDKGKAARALADKIAIAARVDYFRGQFVGDGLRAALERRFP